MTNSDIVLKLINGIVNEPTKSDEITVAEIFSKEENGLVRTTDSNTALISPNLLSKIKPSHINVPVKSVGQSYSDNFEYKPSFWLYLSPASGLQKAEPLVISWTNGNHTTLYPDAGFLGTFGLSCRVTNDVSFWDDLSKPEYNIVENVSLSIYSYPIYSKAYVKVNRSYLIDYLSARNRIAVKVFREIRDIEINDDILSILGRKEHFIKEYERFEVRLTRCTHKNHVARLEVNGYNVLFEHFKQVNKTNDSAGHSWKGISKKVTTYEARHKMPFQYVYVSDDVLDKYEKNEEYDVQPESGAVSYGVHWGVSHCERIGRNAIKIEVKKLYEGAPIEVIEYWNKFSIDPNTIDTDQENIAEKAIGLVKQYLLFGERLSSTLNSICDFNFLPSELISIDENSIEHHGYSQNPDIRPIMNHVSAISFSKGEFVIRCKKLNILLSENLRENNLRKAVNYLGFDASEAEKLRSIKLLEVILKYLFVANHTGLHPSKSKEAILSRIDEFKGLKTVTALIAINSIRQLDAHKSKRFTIKFNEALEMLSIEGKTITNSYSNACHELYDRLIDMFIDINSLLANSSKTTEF